MWLLVAKAIGGADASAKVVAEYGKVAGIEAAVAINGVIERVTEDVVVEFAIFVLAGIARAAGGIDDASESWRRDAGATDDEPAGAQNGVGVKHPHTGSGSGVEG